MNRYLLDGVLADVRAGRRVAVVSNSRTESRAAFLSVAKHLEPEERAMRALGAERIYTPAGGVARFLIRSQLRGLSSDVVVVDGHTPTLDEAADLAVLAHTAEVIR